MKRIVIFLMILAWLCVKTSYGQTLDWISSGNKPKYFQSINPRTDPNTTVDQMWKLSMREIYKFAISGSQDQDNGIEFDLLQNDPKGYAKVRIYLYDEEDEDGKGPMVYECGADVTTPGGQGKYVRKNYFYKFGEWLAWWPDDPEEQSPFQFTKTWESTDLRNASIASVRNNFKLLFGPEDGLKKFVPDDDPSADRLIPVVIEIEANKTQVYSVNLPGGIGKIIPGYFVPPFLDMVPSNKNITGNIFKVDVLIKQPAQENYQLSFTTPNITFYLVDLARLQDVNAVHYCPVNVLANEVLAGNYNLAYACDFTSLPPGSYGLYAEYGLAITSSGKTLTYPKQQQFLISFKKFGANDLRVYDVARIDYQGLPVFLLSGGMSAEYAVEKSLASLAAGISHTWAARTVNGQPDLADGGPISVYCGPDFLDKSVRKTVDLYNTNFGQNAVFETVIIGTGIAHVPYLANAMRAPVLPLHFLVSGNSVEEIDGVLKGAAAQGYQAYSTTGYDPSMKDIGVAWIKLLEMPQLYKDFLTNHQVKNVIIMGFFEDGAVGENVAKRVLLPNQPNDDYSPGSIYMMQFADLSRYKLHFKDFYRYNYGEIQYITDWEGGMTDGQVKNFTNAIKSLASPPRVYSIRGRDSRIFYQWGLDIGATMLKKTQKKPAMVALNEYLIGYPDYELWKGTLPYLYWQGVANNVVYTLPVFGQHKLDYFLPGNGAIKNMHVFVQAKANRQKLVDSLKKHGFTNVTMNTWQKADVWNPADGMNAPCEVAAVDIINNGGAAGYKNWVIQRPTFTMNDFQTLVQSSIKPLPPSAALHPNPTGVETLKSLPDAGLNVKRYTFGSDPNNFWRPKNVPNMIQYDEQLGASQQLIGFLDGTDSTADPRTQIITTAEFDLTNKSDEYDLRVAYRFNVTDKDGLASYDPKLGEEQKMDCFEFTSIPFNDWFDIPSRMMAKQGAVLMFNGSVYDFDYNGIPGVVPFIKKDGLIKGQPQILSYKGEGAFGWKWGIDKLATIVGRDRNVPSTGLSTYMKTIFQNKTAQYPNVLGGMTFMQKAKMYDYTALQPDWMFDR